jgi:hypothetical protein
MNKVAKLSPRDRRNVDASGETLERLRVMAREYTVGTYTATRALPSSPSTTDLRNVLATLIVDLQEVL